jgi:hypothetical protein
MVQDASRKLTARRHHFALFDSRILSILAP